MGAGLVGCIIMRTLEAAGIEFTWWDPDFENQGEKYCAWKASTGCVYPSGVPLDYTNYMQFEESAGKLGLEYEKAEYCFSQKSIPHKEKAKHLEVVKEEAGLKFLNQPSYHVNVQKFVEETRKMCRRQYTTQPQPHALIVHSHGFHQVQETDYRWGWHAKAKVKTPNNRRICFNLKEGRFIVGYLYPIANTDEYYLGTHFMYQKEIRDVEMKDKHLKMLAHINSKISNFAEVTPDWDTLVSGWRPAFKDKTDDAAVVVKNNELFLRPQMANGLRHHVTFSQQVLNQIKEHLDDPASSSTQAFTELSRF